MRYRSVFSKTDEMRFTGNLDLHRTLERTMRRGKLPLAYSQGFNPRPKITLASALPLGYTSENEVMDFWLKESVEDAKLLKTLVEYSPPGINIHSVDPIEMSEKKLQVAIQSAEYEIEILEESNGLLEKIEKLLAEESIILTKKRKGKIKSYDLRPLIIDVKYVDNHLFLHLLSKEGNTGRPDIVIAQLDVNPFDVVVHRKMIHFQSG